MPKFNSTTIANFEDDGFRESWLALSYSSPQANIISSCYFFCTPPTLNIPYLMSITCCQRWFVSMPYLHNHLPSRAWLNFLKFRTPNPPNFKGLHTWAQLTRLNLWDSSKPPHKKPRWSFSMRFATSNEIGMRECF